MSDISTVARSAAERTTAALAARVTGLVTAAAVAANLVIYGVALALGADFAVTRPDGATFAVNAAAVLAMTVVPLLLGGLVLALTTRWGTRAWSRLAWLGLAIGIVTVVMPLTARAGAGTSLALAMMHVVSGTAWFAAVRRALSRAVR